MRSHRESESRTLGSNERNGRNRSHFDYQNQDDLHTGFRREGSVAASVAGSKPRLVLSLR